MTQTFHAIHHQDWKDMDPDPDTDTDGCGHVTLSIARSGVVAVTEPIRHAVDRHTDTDKHTAPSRRY